MLIESMPRRASEQSVELDQPVDFALLRDNKYWNAVEARQVLEAWRASGLTMLAFARQHGFGEHRLSWWKRRLACIERETEREKPTFLPVVVRPDSDDAHATIVVRLGPRVVLEIRQPERVPPRWLADLLRELAEEAP